MNEESKEQSSTTELSTQEKINSLKKAIEELGFAVEETEEGLRVSQQK
jgi:hypothetical protein